MDLIDTFKSLHKDITGKDEVPHVDVDGDGSIGMTVNSMADIQAMLQTFAKVSESEDKDEDEYEKFRESESELLEKALAEINIEGLESLTWNDAVFHQKEEKVKLMMNELFEIVSIANIYSSHIGDKRSKICLNNLKMLDSDFMRFFWNLPTCRLAYYNPEESLLEGIRRVFLTSQIFLHRFGHVPKMEHSGDASLDRVEFGESIHRLSLKEEIFYKASLNCWAVFTVLESEIGGSNINDDEERETVTKRHLLNFFSNSENNFFFEYEAKVNKGFDLFIVEENTSQSSLAAISMQMEATSMIEDILYNVGDNYEKQISAYREEAAKHGLSKYRSDRHVKRRLLELKNWNDYYNARKNAAWASQL